MFHSTGCVVISSLAMWYACPGDETVFNSDHCVSTVRHIHVWSLLHTCGYFISDFLVLWFLIKGDTPLDHQTYWHHALGAIVFYETVLFMDFCVVFGTMLLFIEGSTFFLALRYFLYTHDLSSSIWYYINVVAMFLTFLLMRIYFMIYISIWLGLPFVYSKAEWKELEPIQVAILAQMGAIVVGSLILNFYWFWLMCKMIWRVAGRALFPKKKKDRESIELVKADSLKIRGAEFYGGNSDYAAGSDYYGGSSDEHGKGGSVGNSPRNQDDLRRDVVDEVGLEV